MADAIRVSAPATSANLGPGFDVLALGLDLWNDVVVTKRPGPLTVTVTGEGAGEIPEDGSNLVCRALASGLGVAELTDLSIECHNRIPLGRGLGASAAATLSGLVAANALAILRWAPTDLVARAGEIEGHADNAAACVWGGIVAVGPEARTTMFPVPDDLLFVVVSPEQRVSTEVARGALPAGAPYADVSASMANAIGLAVALERGDLEDLAELLVDRLHEPYRAPLVPGIDALRALAGEGGCLGATISGSGPSMLLWCERSEAANVAKRAEQAMVDAGVAATAKVLRVAPGGVRCRWLDGTDTRLAKAVG